MNIRIKEIIKKAPLNLLFFLELFNKFYIYYLVQTIKNSITAYAFYKQSTFHQQFSLIYALKKPDSQEIKNDDREFFYIFVSNDLIEHLNNDQKEIIPIKIYPPW